MLKLFLFLPTHKVGRYYLWAEDEAHAKERIKEKLKIIHLAGKIIEIFHLFKKGDETHGE